MLVSRYTVYFTAILLVVTALITTPALAQYFGRNKVQYDDFDFREQITDHFQILYYDEKEGVRGDLGRMTERWYWRLSNVFAHEFAPGERKPLIFYANDADFQQTNIIGGFIGEGVRGVTEPLRERVAMPLALSPMNTHQVLGHELVHSFQFDIGLRGDVQLGQLPLWIVEGMAEYLSIGRHHPHTAMWMRDAALRDDLPSVDELAQEALYNPYRYGHAMISYIGGEYGDEAVTRLFLVAGQQGVAAGIEEVLGVSPDELTEAWHASVRDHYVPLAEGRTPVGEVGEHVLSEDLGHGTINVGPSLSPDGRYVSYLSERAIFGINLFVADAETGEIIADLGGVAENPHLDAIRFVTSGGSWSPDGRRVAFIAFAEGDNEVAIWDVETGSIEGSIPVPEVPAMEHPAWSPDGRYVAVAGLAEGESNIYLLDLETGEGRQLTDDPYASMQPAWSPDGETIAYITDGGPGGTDLEQYDFAPKGLALVDVDTGETEYIRPFGDVTHHSPQYSPDGESLYFISSQDGFLDVYRYDIVERETFRVTEAQTGVSGITDLAPALSVARASGDVMFSVFTDNGYIVSSLTPEQAQGTPIEAVGDATAAAGVLPPQEALGQNIVAGYLADPGAGLPPEPPVQALRDYTPRLSLTAIMPPQVGVGIGGGFGTQVAGGVGFLFSDLVENHNLTAVVQARGTLQDIGGQLAYMNRGQRINWGASVGRTPLVSATAFADTDPDTGEPRINRLVERIHIDRVNLLSEYPLSMTRRFEASIGASRYGFGFELEQIRVDPVGRPIDRDVLDIDEPDDMYFGVGSLAYVVDFSFFGFTSPLEGGRSRYEVSPRLGDANFAAVLGDVRRYLRFAPVTLAMRGFHLGNYGAEPGEPFAAEYLGFSQHPAYVRGYDFTTFTAEECPPGQENCPAVDRLQGTHVAVANLELRMPFLGTEQLGLIPFRFVPTDLNLFADAGLAWTADDPPEFELASRTDERVPVFSVGASSRFNILGALVLEVYYAYPFQRPDRGGHFSFQLMPGW